MLTDREKEFILALAECNMSVSAVAENRYFHRNTIHYHLEKVKKRTGLNPKNFYDLIALVAMAKEV